MPIERALFVLLQEPAVIRRIVLESYNCNHFFILRSKLTFIIIIADRYIFSSESDPFGSFRFHFVIV